MSKICKKCNKEFPKWIVVDGKERNLQSRKFCFDCSPWGKHNTKKLDIPKFKTKVIKNCQVCNRIHYHPKSNTCQACIFQKKKKDKQKKVYDIVGRECWLCGYDRCLKALCFHHIDPKTKEFILTVREMVGFKWERVQKEMKKCMLVCTNCHNEIHDSLISNEKCFQLYQDKWKKINDKDSSNIF